MASWRTGASAGAQDDLDGLVGTCLGLAQALLERRGEFYPFAARVSAGGETALIQPGGSGLGEHPDSVAVLDDCWEAVRAEAERARAVAVVSDIAGGEGDAVAVALEHREGHAIEVYLPYQDQDGSVVFGDVRAASGQPRVWA